MRKAFSIISFVLFIINLIICVMYFNGVDLIQDEVIFSVTAGGSIIGMILALFGKRGKFSVIGLSGNTAIFILMMIIPFLVRTFIWNTP